MAYVKNNLKKLGQKYGVFVISILMTFLVGCKPTNLSVIEVKIEASELEPKFIVLCKKVHALGFRTTLDNENTEKCWSNDKNYLPVTHYASFSFSDDESINLTIRFKPEQELLQFLFSEDSENLGQEITEVAMNVLKDLRAILKSEFNEEDFKVSRS
ncbi:hypothetical protein [Aliiglaciecola litoralis]|uniref:DUF4136 domain-containing protein n=1 Tax=Aliiglaciecola litoralis TaxID=582857 RepID=A0ABN1LIW5_9ALTE